MEEARRAFKLLTGRHGKERYRKPRRRWEDISRTDLFKNVNNNRKNWVDSAQDVDY